MEQMICLFSKSHWNYFQFKIPFQFFQFFYVFSNDSIETLNWKKKWNGEKIHLYKWKKMKMEMKKIVSSSILSKISTQNAANDGRKSRISLKKLIHLLKMIYSSPKNSILLMKIWWSLQFQLINHMFHRSNLIIRSQKSRTKWVKKRSSTAFKRKKHGTRRRRSRRRWTVAYEPVRTIS